MVAVEHKRWKLSLSSTFADASTYHKRRSYLTTSVQRR